jgi:hypothetical protein
VPVDPGEVSAPVVALTENADTVSLPPLAVASSPPVGLNATDSEPLPVLEDPSEVSAPVVALTENTDTDEPLAVASSPPVGLNATAAVLLPLPVLKDPSEVSAPVVALTENTDTVLAPKLAVASSFPVGLNATDSEPLPVLNGEPFTGANAGAATAAADPSPHTHTTAPTTPSSRAPRPTDTLALERARLGVAPILIIAVIRRSARTNVTDTPDRRAVGLQNPIDRKSDQQA